MANIKISVIVPVFNAEMQVNTLLDALVNQRFVKEDYEIILVDDGSTDGSRDIIKKYVSRSSVPKIKLVEAEHGGPANARNLGARSAAGEFLLFTDSDCIPNPDWISSMYSGFNEEKVGAVGGTYKTKNPTSDLARFVGNDIEYRHAGYDKYIQFAGTYSFGCRKSLFNEIGGFSTVYAQANAEDNEFSYKIIEAGKLIRFMPEAWVFHPHPEHVSKFIKQQYSRAYWRILLHKRNKKFEGDEYAGVGTFIQPFIWSVPSFLLVLSFGLTLLDIFLVKVSLLEIVYIAAIVSWALAPLTVGILNLRFLSWLKNKKYESSSKIVKNLFYLTLRSAAWFVGGAMGFVKFYVFRKHVSKTNS
ncbi:MAG: glycosyltransferase [Promethearchaeota archaeon]